MTTYEELASSPEEPVQKSKSGVALLVLLGIGILFLILSMICRIPAVRESLDNMLSSTSITSFVVIMILLGIAFVVCMIAALIESVLKRKNQIPRNISKILSISTVFCWILLAINIVLSLVFKIV